MLLAKTVEIDLIKNSLPPRRVLECMLVKNGFCFDSLALRDSFPLDLF